MTVPSNLPLGMAAVPQCRSWAASRSNCECDRRQNSESPEFLALVEGPGGGGAFILFIFRPCSEEGTNRKRNLR